ncbi:MAG: sigma-54-dependent transcriptional regulator [Thermodesulfobacteriota bacterium]
MDKSTILLIEADHRERNRLSELLEDWGYPVATASDGMEADRKLKNGACRLIIADVEASNMDGATILEQNAARGEPARVVFTARHASVEGAVELMKAGATDFLLKPIETTHLRLLVEKVFQSAAGSTPSSAAAGQVNIITNDPAVRKLLDLARRVAGSQAAVFIQGESGTGKELFARYIHFHSGRRDNPFVAVNCAALPESLLESELFGHEKGAFTGAISRKPGKFELAEGGTLLLDEVTEMQFHLQSKLLRILQEKEIDRVGGIRPIKIDVRVIATSNRDIKEAVRKGEFREDLYYRLNTIPIRIPSLGEREEDIPLLTRHFIERYNEIDGRNVKSLTEQAWRRLMNHSFQGNVRELENIVRRAILLTESETIGEADLFMDEETDDRRGFPAEKEIGLPESLLSVPLKEVEKKMIFHMLDKTKGNRTHAAKMLGISVRTLRNKLNEYREGLDSLEDDES